MGVGCSCTTSTSCNTIANDKITGVNVNCVAVSNAGCNVNVGQISAIHLLTKSTFDF